MPSPDLRHGTQLPVPCSPVRSYNVYALGLLLLLWVVVIAAVVEIVRWAT